MLFLGTSQTTDATLRAMKVGATAAGFADALGQDELTGDPLAPEWDFWAHVDTPLPAVRRVMRVPPLDPADAADGEHPDWYEPTA